MSVLDELTEKQKDRLAAEWLLVVALREGLDIALQQDQPVTYRQAVNFGEKVAPTVLGKENRILLGVRESNDARLYEQLATAESARTGLNISRLEYIDREIAKLSAGIAGSGTELSLAEGQLESLRRVRAEIIPKEYTENRLIVRDAYSVERRLPISQKGEDYKEYVLADERRLRVRVLHPDPPEHKIGADMIYEYHDLDAGLVRVCFVQYKRWDGKSLSRDPRMEKQMERMKAIGCDGIFCKEPLSGGGNQHAFRFPHCAVFLRPTDELQNRDARLISSGLHIPLCVANAKWTVNRNGGSSIYKTSVDKFSVDHGLFEDLFYKAFLGSNWLQAEELESVYKSTGVLDDEEFLVFHAQEYVHKEEKQKKTAKKPKRTAG